MTWPLSRCGWCSEFPCVELTPKRSLVPRTKIQMPTWVWLGGDGEDLPQSAQEDASREPARELDYLLCCLPRTMRISRTPRSTWAVPSATKPCLR